MILNGTAFALPLKAESVHCIITSPPYFGLRKYAGLPPMVFGGDPKCEHKWGIEAKPRRIRKESDVVNLDSKQATNAGTQHTLPKTNFCSKCGAWLGDFGLEPTLELYIEHSMAALDECWRVLRADGTMWWNLGDSYAGGGRGFGYGSKQDTNKGCEDMPDSIVPTGLKPKDLCLVPFRFALAAQQRGWWIRSAIIWSKPNPMPESVTDRPTDAYEHIFLMTKAARYWYDAEAVREKHTTDPNDNYRPETSRYKHSEGQNDMGNGLLYAKHHPSGRNLRNFWTFATQPYAEAHFATFPEELPRRCILAGCPEKVCAQCGKGWVRILEKNLPEMPLSKRAEPYSHGGKNSCLNVSNSNNYKPETKTLGWKPSCDCGTKETAKGICLDPFAGSFCTVDVALRSGRIGVGIELSKEYLKYGKKRTENSRKQGVLL